MIKELHIKNFALIEEITVPFYKGLNILTGETGAGKSIIIGAMNAIGGDRLGADVIFTGADFALIEVIFDCNDGVIKLLDDYDIAVDDYLLLSRKIMSSGRSVYKVNGEKVSAKIIKSFFNILVDIHSQREHQMLLKKEQTNLLNVFLDGDGKRDLEEYYKYFDELSIINSKLKMNGEKDFSIREADLLKFEIDEINDMSLLEDEDRNLELEYNVLNNGKLIIDSMSESLNILESDDYGVGENIGRVVSILEKISDLDESLENFYNLSVEAQEVIQDLIRTIEVYADRFELDDEKLATIEDRLSEINKLKSKYKTDVNGILGLLVQKEDKYGRILKFKNEIKIYEQKKEKILEQMKQVADKLYKKRILAADKLSLQIEEVLRHLNLNDCNIDIRVDKINTFNKNGNDSVSFFVSTNKNEPFKPIYDVASGGEMSRIMLAIKTVLSYELSDFTLVFDEIDSGISGRTAQKVAQKMNDLSSNTQIICITHLPQIASMGDNHYVISKSEKGDRVCSTIEQVKEEQVYMEIARLIGGILINDTTISAAKDMVNQSKDYKKR